MRIFSTTRNILRTRKDRIETKKAKLEAEKLEKKVKARKSLIELADFDDVKKYDPKTRHLHRSIIFKAV